MKKIGTLFLLLSLQASLVMAAAAPTVRPQACPSVNAMHDFNINDMQFTDGEWVTIKESNFQTTSKWSMGLILVGEHDLTKEEAFAKIQNQYSTLRYMSGPILDGYNLWECTYEGQNLKALIFSEDQDVRNLLRH